MRAAFLTAISLLVWAAPAIAQTYPMNTPVPRTTSVPALRNAAVAREVEERFKIGLDALSRSDWKAAAAEFERITALNPPEPKGSTAHYDLAIAQANLGGNDDAARNLRAAIALDPGFLAAMANLVSVDLARGDLKEARSAADRFLALAPDSARALYSRGLVALKDGDAQTARDDFGKLLQQNPAYAVAHYDLALAEEKLGNYAAAERELRASIQLAPSYARAQFALGAVLLHLGRKSEAKSAFAQANQDASQDPALANIAAAMRD
ncbi:MAG TPA: tetratricopeptide repeat protein, partial [Candidatus Acidoferrales bacterium]|nr:tetratricopeptide repeat protein [Candidatus Acidoferrales bacterium]